LTVEAHVGFSDIQALLAGGVYMADSYLDLFKVVHKRVKLRPFHVAPSSIAGWGVFYNVPSVVP